MDGTHDPHAEDDASDEMLVRRAAAGELDALDALIRRHQSFLYNVTLRMLQDPQDAQDATQEALLKIATHLSTFRGESSFRTWAYRIAFRHVLDFGRQRMADGSPGPIRPSRPEASVHGFDCFGAYLDRPDDELPALDVFDPAQRLLVAESKASCLFGMLLCLDREQRMAFVLGEIFELTDVVASSVLGTTREAYRQKLVRTRQQLFSFMQERCGLVDPRNPCRCEKKTRAFVRDGVVDPRRLVFHAKHLAAVRADSKRRLPAFEAAVDEACARLFREQPLAAGPDFASAIKSVFETGDLARLIEVVPTTGGSHVEPC